MRSRWTGVAATVSAAVLVAGCGASSSAGQSPAKPLPAIAGSPDPLHTPTNLVSPVAAHDIVTQPEKPRAARGDRLVSIPWTFVGLGNGRRSVTIRFETSGCVSLSKVQLVQATSAVQVTVWANVPSHARVCPQFVRIVNGLVQLSSPLGDRELLHAPVTVGKARVGGGKSAAGG
jgi:hypothetical protein